MGLGNKALTHYFQQLNALQEATFAVFRADYNRDQINPDEVKLHAFRIAVLSAMQKVRQAHPLAEHQALIQSLEHLYEIIFTLHRLVKRIGDFSLFEICGQEFKRISEALSQVLSRADAASLNHFITMVHSFEELYHSTLRVIAPNPLIFLFFIQALMAFQKEIEGLITQKVS